MRGEIVPPSKLMVTNEFPPKGGFLLGGIYTYIYICICIYIYIYICIQCYSILVHCSTSNSSRALGPQPALAGTRTFIVMNTVLNIMYTCVYIYIYIYIHTYT